MIKKILFLIVCLVVLHPNQINAQTYTVVLQPGSTGYDAILSSANPSTNYGTNTRIRSSRNTSRQYERTLLKFDINSIPANANIVSANLYLYGSNHVGTNTSYLQIVSKTWNESTIRY